MGPRGVAVLRRSSVTLDRMDTEDIAAAATGLRGLLVAVESGELPAGPDQAAWLRGAADALAVAAASERAVSEPTH